MCVLVDCFDMPQLPRGCFEGDVSMELRHDLRLPLECSVEFSGKDVVGEGMILNLSTGGWQVLTNRTIPRGMPLLLKVSLPDGEQPMEVELATVRWSIEKKFGLKNMIMGESEWKRLRRFVIDHVDKSELSGSRTS